MTKFTRAQGLIQAERAHGQAFEIGNGGAAGGQHTLGLMKLSLLQGQQHLPVPGDAQVGGQAGPYFQTQRTDTYAEALERLRELAAETLKNL